MPSSSLRLSLIPIDMKPGDPKTNLDYAQSVIESLAERPDIVVLPEMCNTGYTVDPDLALQYAEASDGYSLTRIREMAASLDTAIWGSLAIKDGGKLVNRGFMSSPSGHIDFYDKRHLFILGREPMLYTPGHELAPVIDFKGWKIMMGICYDLRFPVWNRWSDARPYDLLIFPANWPDARAFAWKQLLIARAIENQAYVAGCNRLGEDPYGVYRQDVSYIFNHWGDDISDRDNPRAITATLDGERLDHDRRRFPNLQVADSFRIITN
ncbi:MAG: hypothetical protein NC342_07210 [Pseudoflavonifractor sp.]|nr:nitrilase family protein [Alloprevotella sp.]MCM1117307.1 hypothetical protein [Pseudoflavonifractor sp.]